MVNKKIWILVIIVVIIMVQGEKKMGSGGMYDINDDGRVSCSDFFTMGYCIGKSISGVCIEADLNNDGAINILDFIIIRNQQTTTCTDDFHDVDNNGFVDMDDLDFVSSCFSTEPVGACSKTDLNEDGSVNILDLISMQRYLKDKYDINNDGNADCIDFMFIREPCFGMGPDGICYKADLSGDNSVSTLDLIIFSRSYSCASYDYFIGLKGNYLEGHHSFTNFVSWSNSNWF